MPFPDDDVTFENVTVTGTYRSGVPDDERIEIDSENAASTIAFHPAGTAYTDPASIEGVGTGSLTLKGADYPGAGPPPLLRLTAVSENVPGLADMLLQVLDGGIILDSPIVEIGGTDVLAARELHTLTVTSTGASNPTISAANRRGRSHKVGREVTMFVRVAFSALGAGEGTGAGTYEILLPYAPAGHYAVFDSLGTGGHEQAGVAHRAADAIYVGGSKFRVSIHGSGQWGSATPAAPANGDFVSLNLSYESAA